MAEKPARQNATEQKQRIMEPPPVLHSSARKKRKCPRMCARCFVRNKKKGDRSFIEGCLFALCCCWLCDACFDVDVVVG